MSTNSLKFKTIFGSLIISIAIISLILFQLPLVASFGYEFAVILALLFFLLSGLTNLWRLGNHISLDAYLRFSFLVLFVPVIAVIIISLTQDICSFWYGISFYLILSVVSYINGFFLSEIINEIFSIYHKIIFVFVFTLIALIPLSEIYLNPQVYFYSPLIGFFPGTIYDEDININIPLIFYRTLNLLYFGLFYFFIKRTSEDKRSLIITTFGLIAISFLWFSSDMGFSTNHKKLDEILPAKVESENFKIKYDSDNLDSTEVTILLLNHEYYFDKLKRELGFNPKKKITSYIFSSRLQKKKYFGSEKADIAKPWLNEIYISKDSWENTLYHELVHCFSAEIGIGIFRLADSFNPALIEGFAEAIDNNYDDIELHLLASSAYNYGYKINIEELFSGLNFFKSFSGLSYLFAGSFCKYLLDKYGVSSFSVFYNTGDIRKAYKKSVHQLSEEYYQFLQSQINKISETQIQYYFGRSSIFQKVCPRQIASDLKTAETLMSQRKFSDAEFIFRKVLDKSNDYSALAGLINIYLQEKKYSIAEQLLNEKINNYYGTPYFYLLKLFNADLHILMSKDSLASAEYNFIVKSNPHIQLKLIAELRIDLQNNSLLKDYLEGSDSLKFQILVNMNKQKVTMSSIIPMVNLAEKIKLQSKIFLEIFHSPLIPEDEDDAYVLFYLSKYLLKNNDLVNARKLISLANRKSVASVFYNSFREQFEKCNWFIKNYNRVANKFKYQ